MLPFIEYAEKVEELTMPLRKLVVDTVFCSSVLPASDLFQDGLYLVKSIVVREPFYGFYYRDRLYTYHPNQLVQFFIRMKAYRDWEIGRAHV